MQPLPPEMTRNERIRHEYSQGASAAELAATYKLARARIYQILQGTPKHQKRNVPPTPPSHSQEISS